MWKREKSMSFSVKIEVEGRRKMNSEKNVGDVVNLDVGSSAETQGWGRPRKT